MFDTVSGTENVAHSGGILAALFALSDTMHLYGFGGQIRADASLLCSPANVLDCRRPLSRADSACKMRQPCCTIYPCYWKRRIDMRPNTSPRPRREMKTPLQLVGLAHRRLIVFCAPIAAAGLGTGHRELTWGALILVGITSIFVIFRPISLAKSYTELNSCHKCNHNPNGLSAEPPTAAVEPRSGWQQQEFSR